MFLIESENTEGKFIRFK